MLVAKLNFCHQSVERLQLVPMGMLLDSAVLITCPKEWPRVYSRMVLSLTTVS